MTDKTLSPLPSASLPGQERDDRIPVPSPILAESEFYTSLEIGALSLGLSKVKGGEQMRRLSALASPPSQAQPSQ